MAHVRPAYENISLHGDVFSQVSLALAQSCLPTGGALSAHWQMPCYSALALCTVRTRKKHVCGPCALGLALSLIPFLVMSLWSLCPLALPSVSVAFCLLASYVALSACFWKQLLAW